MSTQTRTLEEPSSGTCLCGKVRFVIRGEIGPFAYCHCTSCQRASGSAFAANAPVRRDDVDWLSGRDSIGEFESSPGKYRAFCRRCGSPIYARLAAVREVLSIRLGLLEQDPVHRSSAHFNVSDQAAWYPITDALPRYRDDTTENPVE